MMPAASRLGRQLEEALSVLRAANLPVALIGGLALAPHNVVRATQDIDLLVDGGDADAVDAVVSGLGYRSIYRSDDAANYLRADERMDFIFARCPIARRLLAGAAQLDTSLGRVPCVSTEGLIGFKLQGLNDDARRTLDAEDIRALLRANRGAIDMTEVREYLSGAKRCLTSGFLSLVCTPMNDDVDAPLCRDGGQSAVRPKPREPFAELDDLMAVVEALCPKWPTRPEQATRGSFLL